MKNLISPKAISVITATLTAAIILSSVALITPAAAQNRLAENPDIHNPQSWTSFHNTAAARLPGMKKHHEREWFDHVYTDCKQSCFREERACKQKYFKGLQASSAKGSRVLNDCKFLKHQCSEKECVRYEPIQ